MGIEMVDDRLLLPSHRADPQARGGEGMFRRRSLMAMDPPPPPHLPPLPPHARRSSSSSSAAALSTSTSASLVLSRNNSSSTPNLFSPYLRRSGETSNGSWEAIPPHSPESPKISIRVHRHLVDQHLFGSPSINDVNGSMAPGKMSMSADFFHPRWKGRNSIETKPMNRFDNWDDLEVDDGRPGVDDIGETVDVEGAHEANDRMVDSNYRAAVRSFVAWSLQNTDRQRRNSMPAGAGRAHHPLPLVLNPSSWNGASTSLYPSSPASDVHLEVYSSTSVNLKSDDGEDNAKSDAVAAMRSRCALYQKRLDALLKTNFDSNPFQECLLDFWDELFPVTAGIHFYNQQSPVPRMSHLHTFLTSPCPKAIGTIQCEIERVRITGKDSKGAKRVKGRFFPSYEYRLFIRDTRNDHLFQSRYSPRKDSVLLIAKNKRAKDKNLSSVGWGVASDREGRGYGVGGIEGATPASLANPSHGGTSKRGITNYYMCLPQKSDVDHHYKSSNKNNAKVDLTRGESFGMALSPLAVQSKFSVEVGRLQSNFIGTEFQIFQATNISQSADVKGASNKVTLDEDSALESGVRVYSIDSMAPADVANTTPRRSMSRRGSDFVRLARRASFSISGRGSSSRNNEIDNESAADPADESDGSKHSSKTFVRRMSWGPANNSNKRLSRRAIANNSGCSPSGDLFPLTSSLSHPDAVVSIMGEVETGAITYTANLLGNRPRIMDVCIPKLMENGWGSEEWRREQENIMCSGAGNNGTGSTTTPMLDRFKTVLNSLSNAEDNVAANINGTDDDHELMLLQNRPPWWNIELGAFVLNFGGRVKVASVKNFQLCERNAQDHIMQFGRIEGRHAFTMDFQHPLTPTQAFAIAISSLQSKISFG